MRQRALLSLALPLAAAGCLAGHAAGYVLVGTSRRDATVHGYLSFAPHFLAACVAVVALSVGLRFTGRLAGRPSAWTFAVLPPVAFCAQELIERLLAGLPAHAVLEPAVYVGLAAQLPLAAGALLVARALVRVADAASRTLGARPVATPRPAVLAAPAGVPVFGNAPVARSHLGRAPPRL